MQSVSTRTPLGHVLVSGFYFLAAVLVTWPLLTMISTRLAGHPFGDSYEYVRHIWWIKHALQTGQPLFDQPLLAYPDGLTGGWLWGNPLQSFPAWLFAFVMPLPSAFNLALLLTLALNGWAMYWLMWRLTHHRGAALLAGVIFLAAPTFQGQLGAGHTGLLVLWPIPLYIDALVQLTKQTSIVVGTQHVVSLQQIIHQPIWVLLAALFFVMSLWGNQLLLIFLTAPVTLVFLLMRLAVRDWPGLVRVIVAAGLGGVISLIFLIPVAREQLGLPEWMHEGNEVRYSADLLSVVTPSFYHPLFGQLEYTHQVLGIEPFERVGYIGLIAGALALVGAWKFKAGRWWLALALAAWLFSLGPLLKILDRVVTTQTSEYVSNLVLPWAALHNLPLLNLTRTPARFNMTVALAVSILAGYGAAHLFRTGILRRFSWIVTAMAAAVLFEYQFFWPLPTIPGTAPDAIHTLSQRDDVRAVFDIPWSHLLVDKDGLFLQTAHQKPMSAGHVTRRTPVDPAKLSILQGTLEYALLDAAGVDIVILHKEWDESDGALDTFTRSRFGQPLYEDDRIAVFEVPPPLESANFLWVTSAGRQRIEPISESFEVYFYAPEAAQVMFSGQFAADARELSLHLDNAPVQTYMIDGVAQVDLSLSIQPGYHTLTLAVEPPCPVSPLPRLTCRAIEIRQLTLEA